MLALLRLVSLGIDERLEPVREVGVGKVEPDEHAQAEQAQHQVDVPTRLALAARRLEARFVKKVARLALAAPWPRRVPQVTQRVARQVAALARGEGAAAHSGVEVGIGTREDDAKVSDETEPRCAKGRVLAAVAAVATVDVRAWPPVALVDDDLRLRALTVDAFVAVDARGHARLPLQLVGRAPLAVEVPPARRLAYFDAPLAGLARQAQNLPAVRDGLCAVTAHRGGRERGRRRRPRRRRRR